MDSEHPLLRRIRPPIATRPIERLANEIVKAIEIQLRGLVVYGMARFGKTWAIKYLIASLAWMRGPMFACRVLVPKSQTATEGAFCSLFLVTFEQKAYQYSSPVSRVKRICNYLIQNCNQRCADLVVLFLDNAERFHPEFYEHLATIDNEMTDQGYLLFVVFVVQSDFTGVVSEKLYDGNPTPHVKQRFLLRSHLFTGLNGEDEVSHVLGRLDEHTEYPEGSGISFSRGFAREAFDRGWRFQQHAPQLWNKASELRRLHRLPEPWTWPMKSFEGTSTFLLTNVAARRRGFDGFTDEDIAIALDAAAFLEMERSRGGDGDD